MIADIETKLACPKCSKVIKPDNVFCEDCGLNLSRLEKVRVKVCYLANHSPLCPRCSCMSFEVIRDESSNRLYLECEKCGLLDKHQNLIRLKGRNIRRDDPYWYRNIESI